MSLIGDLTELFQRHNCTLPKGVIHVGAYRTEENEWYIPWVNNNVVWVEANPNTYNRYTKPLAEKVGQKCYCFAACNVDGKFANLQVPHGTTYEENNHSAGCSSLSNTTALGPGSMIKVPIMSLDTLFRVENLDISKYDFLNIDTEGAELLVLKGFESNIDNINYILVEMSKGDRFNTGCSHDVLDTYLSEKGFELKEESTLYDNDWGDAFYIRSNMELEPKCAK